MDGAVLDEICYNTGITGYQEIFTYQSYFEQLMLTTNAYIGNYGISNDEIQHNQYTIDKVKRKRRQCVKESL